MTQFSIFKIIKKLIFPASKPRVRVGLGVQDITDVKRKWAEIEQHMQIRKPSNFKTAILEADKLLDHVLKLYGYQGNNMGERMKAIPREKYSKDFFDNMWQAHKLRNEMAHNIGYEVMDFEARSAIAKFKRILGELKVL